jgi:hypothetical protein
MVMARPIKSLAIQARLQVGTFGHSTVLGKCQNWKLKLVCVSLNRMTSTLGENLISYGEMKLRFAISIALCLN